MLTNKPTTAVAILRHVWDQEYKDPAKCALMNKYWKCTEDSLAKLMLELGTHKGRKHDNKLLSTVNKIKKNIIASDRLAGLQTFHGQSYTGTHT